MGCFDRIAESWLRNTFHCSSYGYVVLTADKWPARHGDRLWCSGTGSEILSPLVSPRCYILNTSFSLSICQYITRITAVIIKICTSFSGSEKRIINLGLFIPGEIGGFAESKGLLPMADVARNQINHSPKYLPDYELKTEWFNTKVRYRGATCCVPWASKVSLHAHASSMGQTAGILKLGTFVGIYGNWNQVLRYCSYCR